MFLILWTPHDGATRFRPFFLLTFPPRCLYKKYLWRHLCCFICQRSTQRPRGVTDGIKAWNINIWRCSGLNLLFYSAFPVFLCGLIKSGFIYGGSFVWIRTSSLFLSLSSLENHMSVCFTFQGELTDGGPGLTQGDKLRALKSRRPPRPATTTVLRYWNQNQNREIETEPQDELLKLKLKLKLKLLNRFIMDEQNK